VVDYIAPESGLGYGLPLSRDRDRPVQGVLLSYACAMQYHVPGARAWVEAVDIMQSDEFQSLPRVYLQRPTSKS